MSGIGENTKTNGHEAEFNNCIICGKGLVYSEKSKEKECSICHKMATSSAECEDGHFVCDACHSDGAIEFLPYVLNTEEKSPIRMILQILDLPGVHMHGPEHHVIVPCVLLAAYHNNGGDINLEESLAEAIARGRQIPGGNCGNIGVCGAAAGAGIYASIVTGSNPLNGEAWHLPQMLASRCLARIADVGGPRCCKRTSHIAINEAILFTRERLGVSMPEEEFRCTFSARNNECLKGRCPFHPSNAR